MAAVISWTLIVAAFILALLAASQMWGGRASASFRFVQTPSEPDLIILGCEITNPPPLRLLRTLGVVRSVEERGQVLFAVYSFDSKETRTGEPVDPMLLKPDRTGGVEVRSPVRLIPNEPVSFQILAKERGRGTCQVVNPDGANIVLPLGTFRVKVVVRLQSVPRVRATARAVNVGTKTMGWGEEMKPLSIQTVRPVRQMYASRRPDPPHQPQ